MHASIPTRRLVATLAAALLATPPTVASPQQGCLLIAEQEPVLGLPGATVQQFDLLAVTDDGTSYLDVQTAGAGHALLVNGGPAMVSGLYLSSPVGAQFAGSQTHSVNAHRALGWYLRIDGTAPENDGGVYWNTFLLAQRGIAPTNGMVSGVPLEEGSTWGPVVGVWINDLHELLVVGRLEFLGLRRKDDFAVILRTDGAGNLIEEEWLAVKRYPRPGSGSNVTSVLQSRDAWALNDEGHWMGIVVEEVAAVLLLDGNELLRSGQESPLHPGRTIASFVNLSLNDQLDFAVNLRLGSPASTNEVIAFNATDVVVTKSDSPDEIAPATIRGFTGPPVRLTNSGDVFWYATTSAEDTEDECYFRSVRTGPSSWEHRLILQEGLSVVGGRAVRSLRTNESAYEVSEDGRFWIGEVVFVGGDEGVVLADFGSSVPEHGCHGVNEGSLYKVRGDPLIGQRLTYEVDGPMLEGESPILLWSTGSVLSPAGCGVRVGKKEVLIQPSPPQRFAQLVGGPYDGAPIRFGFDLPLDPALVDLTVYGQAWFVKSNGRGRMTNAVAMTIGQAGC